jgi:hypothetical protein
MNDTNKLACDDDARFDRLVDGELSPDEYRNLLASLDDEPGGWRRCALAFLEAQAMRRELAAVRSGDPKPPMPARKPRREQSEVAKFDWRLPLGMAASFVAALTLGMILPDLWRTVDSSPPPSTNIAQHEPGGAVASPDLPRPIGNAQLVVDGPGGTATSAGQVPIYDVPGGMDSYFSAAGSTVPVQWINELKRRGHQVEHGEQYVPVDLEDGRRAVIPVESLKITPVSRRAY